MKYTDAWSRALPPVQAKQSMYEAETIDESCLRESKRNYFPFSFLQNKKQKKGQNGHHFVVETSLQSWVSHKADIFVQA